MTSNWRAHFSSLNRPGLNPRRPDKVRRERRFSPLSEALEGRIAPTGNIVITAVSAVDSNDQPLTTIYQGDVFYIRADFTTVGLPDNASYRVRFMSNGITVYSDYVNDGAVGFHLLQSWNVFGGLFQAEGGPQTLTATVDPDKSVPETSYTDNTLTAQINGISSPSKLVITDQIYQPPASVKAGAPFSLTVAVEDTYGNVVPDDEGPVAVDLASGPDGSLLGGITAVSAINGQATFSGLTLNKVGPGDTLALSRPGLTSTTTNPIAVVPASASKLEITQPPSGSGIAGTNLGVQVSEEDDYGNVETSDITTKVTATLAKGAGPLLGPGSLTVLDGVATFTNLADDTAETIAFDFTSGQLAAAISDDIVIGPAAANKLVIQGQPSSRVVVGQPLASQLMVDEEDQFGNLESGDDSTVVAASPATGAGPLEGASAVVSGGVAMFPTLADAKSETVSLKFGVLGLAGATTGPVVVGKATPTITWAPATVALGTALGPAQLDAIAMNYGSVVPGTFAYSPGSGTVLAAGSHMLAATFTPTDASDYTATAGTATVDVLLATTTSLSASTAKTTSNQPVTFTASVSPPTGGVTPTGSVTFLNGSTVLGTSNLDGMGHATLTTTVPPGSHSITARYSGDLINASSISTPVSLFVRALASGDFDGDGKSDIAIYDQTSAVFYVVESGGGSIVQPFGNPKDVNIPIAGDFDGDGKTDIAIYDQTSAVFYVVESGGGSIVQPFGNPKDVNIPIAGDYDGDGKTDLAIYDQSAAVLFVVKSGGGSIVQPFGSPSHKNIPIAGDFDGDGKTDIAIYDQTSAVFYVVESGGGSIVQPFGNPKDVNIPIAGDYDGDGKTDLAIYDQSTAILYVVKSGGGTIVQPFGNSNDLDIPLAGDFDGDGKTDIAIYDQTAATFFIVDSDGGSLVQPFGNKKHTNLPA